MRILLLDHLSADEADQILGPNVVYRPDALSKGPGVVAQILASSAIDAIVTCRRLSEETMAAWARNRTDRCYYVKIEDAGADEAWGGLSSNAIEVIRVPTSAEGTDYVRCMKLLERAFSQNLASRRLPHLGRASASRRVTMIGGGIVNLINARELCDNGYEVEVSDSLPDPRTDADWTSFGCSRGGDDARMFTLSEMDNYNCRSVHEDMNSLFRRDISELGWNIHHPGSLSHEDKSWISDFESIPPWLADSFNDDIFALNRESGVAWDAWIESDPELFERSLIRQGILRIYSDPRKFKLAVERQDRIGATRSVLSGDEVAKEQPALAAAVANGKIAGGVNVAGFTVNAHKFMRQLIDRLEARGVRFRWGSRARQLVFDDLGRVAGIRFADGVAAAENVVISPGAYCDGILRGTSSQGRICGVIGAWLRLPNIDWGLRNSLKLSRMQHITEDANITVATDANNEPILVIGSGYGYTGTDVSNIDQRLLKLMYEGLIDTARQYFPEAHRKAVESGQLEQGLKYCVRPWTATSLGLFEVIPTSNGGYCVVVGGHNTGGFAQAPACGRAVIAALRGEGHIMHTHYHPDRCSDFLAGSAIPAAAFRYG